MTPSGCPTLSQCPQLEEADIRAKKADSRFDPKRSEAGSKCRTATTLFDALQSGMLPLGFGAADAIQSA